MLPLYVFIPSQQILLDAERYTATFVRVTFIAMLMTPIACSFNVTDMYKKIPSPKRNTRRAIEVKESDVSTALSTRRVSQGSKIIFFFGPNKAPLRIVIVLFFL